MKVKANVLEMANKEEEKLQFAEFAKEADEARKKIAQAGYDKSKNNYRLEQSFETLINEIKNDIEENLSSYYKL